MGIGHWVLQIIDATIKVLVGCTGAPHKYDTLLHFSHGGLSLGNILRMWHAVQWWRWLCAATNCSMED